MEYYLDVFTPGTWSAFRQSGATVTGFSKSMGSRAASIEVGDRLLCYLKGAIGWVGALEATGPSSVSDEILWGRSDFPVRVPVRPMVALPAELHMPMLSLEGKLSYYPSPMPPKMYASHLQGSPRRMRRADGEAIYRALLAHEDGVRPQLEEGIDDDDLVTGSPSTRPDSGHTEVQALLAEWGATTGCTVWVPRSDRSRVRALVAHAHYDALITDLPLLFGGRAQSTVENIDVLWLRGGGVVAAFEVEHSTSIYSGLLRMSDLVASIPNISIALYIVGPEARRRAVKAEITRPTFATLPKPLADVCGFISYETLSTEFAMYGPRLRNFRPEGIADIAEYFVRP